MTASARVARITGPGTGIGKAAALALLKEGYRVVLAGRRRELLEKTNGAGRHSPEADASNREITLRPAAACAPFWTWRRE